MKIYNTLRDKCFNTVNYYSNITKLYDKLINLKYFLQNTAVKMNIDLCEFIKKYNGLALFVGNDE
jgi:hypothetical protein